MRVTGLTWKPFRLAFAEDFRTATTAHSAPRFREGVIVRLTTNGGISGIGEASPLRERRGGSVDDVVRLLSELTSAVVGMNDEELQALTADFVARPGGAATAFALDVAVLDVSARATDQPIAGLLAEEEGEAYAATVPVNATIGQIEAPGAADTAVRAQANGYRVAKVKVGVR
ncbi:MAG: mandelate racemase/muconate lactonizing enzyme family protein, partial [Dehalococcoidia bacterium]